MKNKWDLVKQFCKEVETPRPLNIRELYDEFCVVGSLDFESFNAVFKASCTRNGFMVVVQPRNSSGRLYFKQKVINGKRVKSVVRV